MNYEDLPKGTVYSNGIDSYWIWLGTEAKEEIFLPDNWITIAHTAGGFPSGCRIETVIPLELL